MRICAERFSKHIPPGSPDQGWSQFVSVCASNAGWQLVHLRQQRLCSSQLEYRCNCEKLPHHSRQHQELPCSWLIGVAAPHMADWIQQSRDSDLRRLHCRRPGWSTSVYKLWENGGVSRECSVGHGKYACASQHGGHGH